MANLANKQYHIATNQSSSNVAKQNNQVKGLFEFG